MWKWVLESRLQASDFQGNETHIHIPEWENTSPWDRAIEQLVRLSPCTMCPLRTEPGQGWGQVAGRCCHLKGWGMPEPEGRMAASKGTEQLKAREKNQTLKYWSFHLQVRVKQRLSVTKSGGKKKKQQLLLLEVARLQLLETNSGPELAGVLIIIWVEFTHLPKSMYEC